MDSKKDIGKFFRENLDQLDLVPSTSVWVGIEKDLNEKKKKKRFFIWFFIAAFVGGSLSTYTILQLDRTLNTNTINEKKSNSLEINSNSNNESVSNNNFNNHKNSKDNSNSSISSSSSKIESLSITNSKNKISSSISAKSIVNSEKKQTQINKKTSLKNITDKNKNFIFSTKKTNSIKKNPNAKNESYKEINSFSLTEKLTENENTNITEDSKTNISASEISINSSIIDSIKKKKESITEKENQLDKTKKDSLEELPKEKNFKLIVAPYFGFTYSGNFGKGNVLSEQYNILNQGGLFSENYGILFRWMGTEKLGVQTGIGKVISKRFYETENNTTLFYSSNNLSTENLMQSYAATFTNDNTVTFHEEISYLEVPLEAYFIFSSKKKFGISSSFGFSFFFLNKNDVYIESDNVNKFRIGSLNNAIPQSVSINAKLNLFYQISKKIQFDLYPEFQYQVMKYNDTQNYYPYYFSIKSGFTFKL